jgi:hypothetical protein
MAEPKFTQTQGAFSMSCRVEVNIRATAEIVCRLLTDDGSTEFAMEERFSGLMLPLVKGSLPDPPPSSL